MSGNQPIPRPKQTAKTNTYHDLISALNARNPPMCPVCSLVDTAVRGRIDAFLYEQVNIIERRAEIRSARGFCSVHGSMISGIGRMLGTAIIYQDILNDVLRDIDDAPKVPLTRRKKPGAVRDAVKPGRKCSLCEYEREQETYMLRTLVAEISDPAMYSAFEGSAGICLPHFQMAIELPGNPTDQLATLIELQTAVMRALKAELEEYLHKSNGSFDYEGMGPEANSPVRAVRMVSGRVIHTDGRF